MGMLWRKKQRMFREPQILELHWMGRGQGKNSPNQMLEALSLFPSYDEYWDRFPSAAIAIAQNLFEDMHVLTTVHAFHPNSKTARKYKIYSDEQMFLRTYFETLRLHGFAESIHFHEPEELISQTNGADIPLSTMLFTGNYGVLTYEAYGYASLPAITAFQQAKDLTMNVPHILYLDYGRYPDEINLMIDQTAFPLTACISRIKNACQNFDIPLKIDSKLSQYAQ